MNTNTNTNKEEQILIRITGNDRPGLTASVMEILASKDAKILDIGQADIHSTLSLGVLIRISEAASGQVMKELLFKATELGVNIGFEPVTDDEYENWVNLQVGCSKFKYKSDTKSARIQLVKLLIFNTLYCQIVL